MTLSRRLGRIIQAVLLLLAVGLGIHNWTHPIRIKTVVPHEMSVNTYGAATSTAVAFVHQWLTYSPADSTYTSRISPFLTQGLSPSTVAVTASSNASSSVTGVWPIHVTPLVLPGSAHAYTVSVLVAQIANGHPLQATVQVPVESTGSSPYFVFEDPSWQPLEGAPSTLGDPLTQAGLSPIQGSEATQINSMLTSFFSQLGSASSLSTVQDELTSNPMGVIPLNGWVTLDQVTCTSYQNGASIMAECQVVWTVTGTRSQMPDTYWVTVVPQNGRYYVSRIQS